MSIEILLQKLSDGKFHSGDDLGKFLGVSRTAIWKQLKKVEGLGITLTSVKGKGYCIEGGLDLLSESDIQDGLTAETAALISDIDVLGVIDSTNVLAMSKALQGAKGYVCTAEQQTAGRGRRGRSWASPYGGNIYLSVVWEFAAGAAALEGLSLAVGIAVVDALTKAGVAGVGLKWPNDILHNKRKLAGILIEITGDAAGPCQVVTGIGLNVRMPEEASREIDQPWIDAASLTDAKLRRSDLLSLLLNELMPLLSGFEQRGFAAYRDRWQSLDSFAGKEVRVTFGQEATVGIAVGVDDSGSLVIDTDSGRRLFSGGEVTLRSAQ